MALAMKHRKSVTASLFGVVAFGLAAVAVWFLLQPHTPEDLLDAVGLSKVRFRAGKVQRLFGKVIYKLCCGIAQRLHFSFSPGCHGFDSLLGTA